MRLFAIAILIVLAAPAAAQLSAVAPQRAEVEGPPGWLGISLDTTADGAVIARPFPRSPAADAGLRAGEVVRSVDGTPVGSAAALIELIGGLPAGTEVVLSVADGEVTRSVTLVLAARPDRTELAGRLVGTPFPFAPVLDPSAGETVTPSPGPGATVVEFWATWCGPCRAAAPTMEQLRAAFDADELRVYAISSEEADTVATHVAESGHMTWDVYADPTGEAEASAFVTALPTWFVLDSNGTVVGVYSGMGDLGQVEADVRRLLAE